MTSLKRSSCPIANVLDIMGDKWTLLVIRDLFMGKKTYKEFTRSPEGIPTNILAERLKRLASAGIINKSKYQDRPVRYAYALTEKGRDLEPAIWQLVKWGNKHVEGTLSEKQIKALVKAKLNE